MSSHDQKSCKVIRPEWDLLEGGRQLMLYISLATCAAGISCEILVVGISHSDKYDTGSKLKKEWTCRHDQKMGCRMVRAGSCYSLLKPDHVQVLQICNTLGVQAVRQSAIFATKS